MPTTRVLIIGASVAGLATAACLRRAGIDFRIIEKSGAVGNPWRHHYHRLHLHTPKALSQLPYLDFDSHIPRYPSRQQVVEYLHRYSRYFQVEPEFFTTAESVEKTQQGWLTTTNRGLIHSRFVVAATGAYGKARTFQCPGLESFPGPVLHSSQYQSGAAFKGQRVLVVGFGNSSGEIAIDLAEQGAIPTMAVRSAVNVIPKEVFGIPNLQVSILLRQLPPKLADALSAPLIRLLIGDIRKLGLQKKACGPFEEIATEGSIPLIDIGTIALIRKGKIKVASGISHIEGNTIHFSDTTSDTFDAIVAGIGYDRDFSLYQHLSTQRISDLNRPLSHQEFFGKDGLFFCGFWVSPTGQIREISRDAKQISAAITTRLATAPSTLNPTA